MNNFKLVRKEGYSDATSSYDVVVSGTFTVGEFIDCVLKTRLDDWGEFLAGTHWSDPKICDYSKGTITSSMVDEYDDRYKDKPIKSITAHGGWSLMSYYLEL
jgi:hypothetical protein